MKRIINVLLLFCLNIFLLNAQVLNYAGRQELLNTQLKNLSIIQDSIFNYKDEYINGKLFYPPSDQINHPFFENNSWKSGKIWSSGRTFDVETIKYDINTDYLVEMHNWVSSAFPIYFTREFITEFIIDGHHFKYLKDFEDSFKGLLKPGYYEILYDGLTKVYIRWEKTKNFRTTVNYSDYSPGTYFFLKKEGNFIRITNHKSLIKALDDHKKEIRSYMKAKSIRFNRNKYGVIVEVLTYYDNL